MLKLLVVVAFVANSALLVSSTGSATQTTQEYQESYSSLSSSSSSDSFSSTFESSSESEDGDTTSVNNFSSTSNTDINSASSASFSSETYNKRDENSSSNTYSESSDSSDTSETTSSSSTANTESNDKYANTNNNNQSSQPDKSECGAHEIWEICPFDICRPNNCSDLGFSIACPGITVDGKCPVKSACICEEGYARNESGACVLYKKCPSCGGDPNAESGCGMNCGRLCSNYDKDPSPCNKMCIFNSCECKIDYVYDEIALKCVLPEDCSPKCGRNEVPDSCVNGGCYFARTCDDLVRLNGSRICVDPRKCKPGCLCKPGYLRNKNGICIPEYKCPNSQCKNPNETYVQCVSECVAQTCDQVGYGPLCTLPNSKSTCQPGCICIDGYVKDSSGVCIPKENCPICGGDENAKPGCGVNCGRLCSNYNKGPVSCIEICYENSCDCKKNYVFDENLKRCVLPKQCTPTCGVNEVFDGCANGGCYATRKCKDLDTNNGTIICVDVSECIPGCLCKPGYARNNKGICIPEFKCPNSKCKNPNETFLQCVSECQVETCNQLGYGSICPIGENQPCQAKCTCIDGYLRNDDGVCVPKNDCSTCGGDPNAQSGCGINCGRLCSNYNKDPVACPAICLDNACDCKKDHVFDENLKKCVLPQECTPTCGVDEVFDGCANGGCYTFRTCEDLDRNGSSICVDVIQCIPGCLCKEGYLRNNTGICIPENTCPNSKCKKANETYVQCPNLLCTPRSCDELGYPVPCPIVGPDGQCPGKPGCICRNGFLKNKNGVCVPQNECPSCGGDKNATSGCGNPCGRRCSDFGKGPLPCPLYCRVNSCDCKEGYYFDEKINKCVLLGDCSTPVCGKNEVLDSCANGGCHSGRTCDDSYRLNGSIICVDPIKCNPGCLCKPGFLRNKTGVCIPEYKCPNSKCKKLYETFRQCVDCTVETCDQLGFGPICPRFNKSRPCEAKCTCIDGYLKDNKGNCIPQEQCPTCGGDPNAQSGCGVNCGRLCSNYNKGPVVCTKECRVNSCVCKKDHVYDTNIQKCVLPQDCTPVCGQNEEFSTCVNGECFGAKNCSDLDASYVCVRIKGEDCLKGCKCKEGYVKNNNGVCVLKKECPDNEKCKGTYEFYDYCLPNCSPQTCSSLEKPVECLPQAAVCRPGCRCAEGFYRNDENVCIPERNCPKSCPKDEVWNTCINGNCYGARNCSQIGAPIKCVKLLEGACIGGCLCRDNYLRNEEGVCIPPEQCPKYNQTCKSNEEFDLCPTKCPRRLCGFDDRKVFCPKQPVPGDKNCPEPACRCKSGFYKNNNGDCVTWDKCNICKKNETLDLCPFPCPPRTCGIDDRAVLCLAGPKEGDPECPKPACRCKDGYSRKDDGECVAYEDCHKEKRQPI